MLRACAVVVAAALTVAGLAACGEPESTSGLPVYTPAAVASASSSASPAESPGSPAGASRTPSPTGSADGVSVTEGRIRARGTGKAVAAAWVTYWQERFAALHELDAERPQLLAVASGDALQQVRGAVAEARRRGERTVGTAVVNVSRIRVGDAGAKVTSCLDNTTTNVDAQLRPVTPPVPRYGVSGTVVRADGGWQVTQVLLTSPGSC